MSSFCFPHVVVVVGIDDSDNGYDNNHGQDVLQFTSNTKAKRETEKEVMVEEESVQSGEYTLKEKKRKTKQIKLTVVQRTIV